MVKGKTPKRMKGKTVKKQELSLGCEWSACNITFSSMANFLAHVRDEHINRLILPHMGSNHSYYIVERTWVCEWRECGCALEGSPSDITRHIYLHCFHAKLKSLGEGLIAWRRLPVCRLGAKTRNSIPPSPPAWQCTWTECNVVSDNAEDFYRHVDRHVDSQDASKEKFKCVMLDGMCNFESDKRSKVREHMRSHTQERVVACPVCGGFFASNTKLIDHLERQLPTQTGSNNSHSCDYCKKTFPTARILRDHRLHHINQYHCQYCEMTCTCLSALDSHVLHRHSNERPFMCTLCDYRCKKEADLRKHEQVHLVKERSFPCPIKECKEVFKTRKSRNYHLRKVHKVRREPGPKYACHLCANRYYARASLLTIHLRNVHKFDYPRGHSRFYYKLDTDGYMRVNLVRYETESLKAPMGGALLLNLVQSEDDEENEESGSVFLTLDPAMSDKLCELAQAVAASSDKSVDSNVQVGAKVNDGQQAELGAPAAEGGVQGLTTSAAAMDAAGCVEICAVPLCTGTSSEDQHDEDFQGVLLTGVSLREATEGVAPSQTAELLTESCSDTQPALPEVAAAVQEVQNSTVAGNMSMSENAKFSLPSEPQRLDVVTFETPLPYMTAPQAEPVVTDQAATAATVVSSDRIPDSFFSQSGLFSEGRFASIMRQAAASSYNAQTTSTGDQASGFSLLQPLSGCDTKFQGMTATAVEISSADFAQLEPVEVCAEHDMLEVFNANLQSMVEQKNDT